MFNKSIDIFPLPFLRFSSENLENVHSEMMSAYTLKTSGLDAQGPAGFEQKRREVSFRGMFSAELMMPSPNFPPNHLAPP